ncbi:hypothetical protein Tco_1071280, partial [Tanacetum coccineum]
VFLGLMMEPDNVEVLTPSHSITDTIVLPMQPVAPPSPDYVPGPEHPPSPDYVPDPEHPPFNLSCTYTEGMYDDEPSRYYDDDKPMMAEDPFEERRDYGEERKTLTPATLSLYLLDPSFPIQTGPQKTIRLEPPMSPSMEARIAEYVAAPSPPSPLLPCSPPLSQIPLPPLPPPPSSLHLPPPFRTTTSHRKEDIPEVDLTEAVEEVAPTTLEGVNARVTGLAAVQEQDTQDVYVVIEDTQDKQTQLFQRVDGLVKDRQFYYETARLLDREALVSREAWAYFVGLSSAVHYELQAYRTHTQMQDYRIASQESLMTTLIAHNNMPPRRSSATARAAAATATPMTAAAVEQLIEARVSATLANHETLFEIAQWSYGD